MKRDDETRRPRDGGARSAWFCWSLLLLLLTAAAPAHATPLAGTIIDQQLDARRYGYTVLGLWGTPYEMGYAHGNLLAQEIADAVAESRFVVGDEVYTAAREAMAQAVWEPQAIVEELEGMLAGIHAAAPRAQVDLVDLQVLNTVADWFYPPACHSHSTWGSRVSGSTRALHSRRLDTPLILAAEVVKHHLIVARAADGGGTRWVNFAWPGYVTSLTGVNEQGVLVSLHDLVTNMKSSLTGSHLPRMVANRLTLTAVAPQMPPAQQLDRVVEALDAHTIMTGGFINYYAPGGHGAVLTCLAGERCSKVRRPQPAFHDGEVLITTNAETDGLTAPEAGEYIDDFYADGAPKTLAQHFGVLREGPSFGPKVHLLSVAYRGPGEMTLWFEGWTGVHGETTGKLELEFAELFDRCEPAEEIRAPEAETIGLDVADDVGGCAVASPGAPASPLLLLLVVGLLLARSARRSSRASGSGGRVRRSA